MKKLFILTMIVLASVFGFAQSNNNEDEVVKIDWYNQHATKEGELIVKFADGTPILLQTDNRGMLQTAGIQKVDALLQQYPVARAERLCPNDDPQRQLRVSKSYNGPDVVERDLSRLCRFVMEDPMQTYQMIEALNELEEVEFAEPNYMAFALGAGSETMSPISPISLIVGGGAPKPGSYFNPEAYMSEPMYSLQWGLEVVHLPELWAADTVTTNNSRPIIAILDTGVDINHPDLAANIWTNPNENENGYDDDNNSFVDDIHGWDFVNQTADMHDWNSHGTHCAGIAAAVGDNGIGITGANPKALIMPVAVLQSNGSGDMATIIQGINYAKNNGANVLNMSFGSYSYSIALEQALGQAYQNAVLVAAAGNDGMAIDSRCDIPQGRPMYPAALTFVFGVEATQQVPGRCGFRTCWSNYDCDGPTFSQYGEEQLYNYELQAPGAGIYSTVPNGNYRNYSGTSMATPLVAGGVSALIHAKPYLSQEMLWGDLINTAGNHVDFKACYDTGVAPAQLQFVTFETNDTINGDGDGRPDAGETICLYPTLRTTWGATNDITMWLTLSEFEDPNIVTFLDTEPVDFGWSLSAYAMSKSANPVRFTINPSCADSRYIKMEFHATASNDSNELVIPFTIQIENIIELGGAITDTVILYPNHYAITRNLSITENALLIVEPGTILDFRNAGLANLGRIYAVGTPDSLIIITASGSNNFGRRITLNYNDTLQYCKIENTSHAFTSRFYIEYDDNGNLIQYAAQANDLIIINCNNTFDGFLIPCSYSNIFNCRNYISLYALFNGSDTSPIVNCYQRNNLCNNYGTYELDTHSHSNISQTAILNIFNFDYSGYSGRYFIYESALPDEIVFSNHLYMGSAREEIVRKHIYDANYPFGNPNTFGVINLNNMAQRPSNEAHGIVWKVVVNGYDAQDEFEQLPPLGCGRHKFEVYFNRAMDTLVTPMLSLGVRPPYTQHAIAEDGHWSADSTIYTAYLTINGTTATDGLNRIYVANARDNEHFEIPYENQRFNVQVASAGSLSNEFMATPGLGKVELEWNNNEGDFEDYLGYNMYRYTIIDTLGNHSDTLMLNTSLLQDTLFTDYDVTPGQRYYYFYKVLRTNLTESDASLNVTTVPLTATKGDANGSMAVDVADVVTIVSYLTNGNPQPFIFEAADANSDGNIDILDIVSVINLIINRGELPEKDPIATAYYTIEDGILFVDTPVELGGVQVLAGGIGELGELQPLQAMNGFEQVKVNTNDGALFLAYSMSGKKLEAGKHALLRIGDASISDVALSDPTGHNVMAVFKENDTPENETIFLSTPYPNPFNNTLIIPFIIGDEDANSVSFTVTNIMGQTVANIELGSKNRGEYQYEWNPNDGTAAGIYTIVMYVDGRKVQQSKVVYVK